MMTGDPTFWVSHGCRVSLRSTSTCASPQPSHAVIKRDPLLESQIKVACARAKDMVAQGKMTVMPPACLAPPPSAGSPTAAKAKPKKVDA
jgi:hypothetical protein